MLFVEVDFVQLAASRRFELISVWAKTFIDMAGELPRNFSPQKQLHFALITALKAINTSQFTQFVILMKFRPECPNWCRVHSALLVQELMLAQLCYVVCAYCK